MCYTNCFYENMWGDCKVDDVCKAWLRYGVTPHCCNPLEDLVYNLRKEDNMKILNKNRKLKHSKMIIDLETYEKICAKHNLSLEQHMKNIERMQYDSDFVPSMEDVSIMMDVYSYITKIIRKRR